jgi:acyl-CoA synthetase (AMP-forming)/AMP-acid ligase II
VVVDGWMRTGDAGYLNDDGYLFVVDQLNDMIISGGENVYSAEVENALCTHHAVTAAAVIGVPDDGWGERVHAFVTLADGQQPDEDELRAHTRNLIAAYKVPRSIRIIDKMPTSGAGKILKRQLRDTFLRPDAQTR